jgi:hypothetical protein
MLSTRLIELIEYHADQLTREAIQDIVSNPRTPSFLRVPRDELAQRVATLYRSLGDWIGAPDEDKVRTAYEDWGRRRFRQGIPISEIMYAVILTKQHLRRFIHDHGLMELSGQRAAPAEVLPVHLYGLQELNFMVGEFFDRALYHLARGYEMEAAMSSRAGRAGAT